MSRGLQGSLASATGIAVPDAALPFSEALRRRASRAVSFYVALGIFGLFAGIGLATGLLTSDIVVTLGIFFILALALDVLYGMIGLLNFGLVGFFAISAYTSAILNARLGVDIWLSSTAGIILAIAFAALIGAIVLRLSPTYFIFGTLAFGLMVHSFLIVAYPLTGGGAALGGIERPQLLGMRLSDDLSMGVLVWALAAAAFWYTLCLRDSRTGRAMRAVRSDPQAAQSLGVNAVRMRFVAFIASAFLAAVAGALFATYYGSVHPDSFSLGLLIDIILMVFLGGAGTVWGSLLGATVIVLLPEFNEQFDDASDLINGLLFVVILLALPGGIAQLLQGLTSGWRQSQRAAPSATPAPQGIASAAFVDGGRKATPSSVSVDRVSKQFGGVKALTEVSFTLQAGRIRGLIGPNGAGKSTAINLITGYLRPDDGSVSEGRAVISHLRPDQIARSFRIVRTFQHERLFDDLSVIENVMVGQQQGAEGALKETLVSLFGVRSWANGETVAYRKSVEALASLGLGELAHAQVSTLPNGTRKLIEIARACAGRPSVLLLDETAAGLNSAERENFGEYVRGLRDAGMAVLMIEHDLELVLNLADDITVLDFGKVIADGSPDTVRKDPEVISAYIGGTPC